MIRAMKDIIDNKKYIFVDLDGTLTDDNEEISKETIDVIKKLQTNNYEIVICSGRTRTYTIEKSRKCGASKFVISSNGAEIYDRENNIIIYKSIMEKSDVKKILEYSLKHNLKYLLNCGDFRIKNEIESFDKVDIILENADIDQCVIYGPDIECIRELNKIIKNMSNIAVVNYSRMIDENIKLDEEPWMDVSNKDVSKGNAIKIFIKNFNIPLENTYAIGDSANDISMFKEVYYKVAMKNSIEKLKLLADEITLSNNENGVAKFLEKLL